jgi:hypothetical protein
MRTITSLLILWAALLSASTAMPGEKEGPPQGTGAVVVFCCDFSHYPPVGNVEISHEACDHSISFDDHPHLRLLTAGKSRFSMRFSLPEAPTAASLQVVHLASSGPDGKCVSPVSIVANEKTVVENWNVGRAESKFTETRWPIGDKLQSGDNQIVWTAGDLESHYWLRRVMLYVRFDSPVTVAFPVSEVEHALAWEGRFSQCSYNALATVLDHFYGVEAWTADRDAFERQTFVAALKPSRLEDYYGWGPWTSYMVGSRTIRWNGRWVDDLNAERFTLATKNIPQAQGEEMIVRYQPGEKTTLKEQLLSRLEKGPVIVWTPYAAALDQGRSPWRHVRAVDPLTDAVNFRPFMTHSVVVHLEGEKVKVYDNSRPNGTWVVDPHVVVATAAAMVGSVRVDRGNGKPLYEEGLHGKGLEGATDDAYNVVFWKK